MNQSKHILALLLLIGGALAACQPTADNKSKPNVLLILVDDYGYADISFEGNTQIQTPAIDKIAKEGVRFSNFYQSAAACAPTRASLLTGRYHLRTGVWGVHWGRDYIATDETTFADLAQRAGYVTGAFGKWHNGKSSGYHSWERGFDVGLESNLYQYFNTNVLINNRLVNIKGPVTDVITDNAIRFIEDNKDKPFLCYVPYQSIHEPFNCPNVLFQKYKAQGYSDHVARLYGMIEVLDTNIGRLTNKITELGLDENTLIMFMVDDGCSPGFDLTYSTRRMNNDEKAERRRGWAKELRGTKANIYEGGVKSPCYMRWKGTLEAGKQINAVSGVIDVLPTLADICGFEIPEDNRPIDGHSLQPVLFGQSKEFENRFYFDNTNLYRIPMDQISIHEPEIREMYVRHRNFKLIRLNHKLNGREGIEYLLYDLDADEKEEHNIIHQHPKMANLLKDTLATWYSDLLASDNAFKPATFNVGNWSERSTFINLDAIAGKMGTLKRDNGSGFEFSNWDTPGNSLSYNLNVTEAGNYFIELIIDADDNDQGAILEVSTEHDQTTIEVNNKERVQSGVLNLPKGEQILTIRLKSVASSGKAMNWMKNILMHRQPLKNDKEVIQNCSLKAKCETQMLVVGHYAAPFEFCTNAGFYGQTMEAKKGEIIHLHFSVSNPGAVAKTQLFVNFKQQHSENGCLPEYSLKFDQEGLYTINAVYTNLNGNESNALLNVRVE